MPVFGVGLLFLFFLFFLFSGLFCSFVFWCLRGCSGFGAVFFLSFFRGVELPLTKKAQNPEKKKKKKDRPKTKNTLAKKEKEKKPSDPKIWQLVADKKINRGTEIVHDYWQTPKGIKKPLKNYSEDCRGLI